METINTCHSVIRKNHASCIPRYILAFDTETKRTQDSTSDDIYHHSLRLGVATFAQIKDMKPCRKKTFRFDAATEFWSVLGSITKPNYTTWVVGHNIIFDLIQVGMPGMFERGELVIDWPRSKRKREDNNEDNAHCWTYIIVDEPTTIIAAKLVRTQGRIVFVDTMNWFPQKLAEIGRSLGLEKGTMPSWDAPDAEWFDYCERDTDITFQCFVKLIQWQREKNLGMFRYTAPSQAMAAYRHRFMEHTIFPHAEPTTRKMEREAFYGGRVECWRIGKVDETVYIYDINSFYPYIMQREPFPVVLDRYGLHEDKKDSLPNIDFANSIAVVKMESREANFPMRTDYGVIYPVGRYTTILCGPELAYAVRQGYAKHIMQYATYRTEHIFNAWVSEFWALRKQYQAEGNSLYDMFTKFLMNSLFGKFAQRTAQWQNVEGDLSAMPWSTWAEIDMTTRKLERYRSFGYQVQRMSQREEIDGTFIAISAFVTSYGRMHLNRVRHAIGDENVYYQGSDSVIVNRAGMERIEALGLVDDSELGKFKHQLTATNAVIHGASDYVAGQRVVVAGRPMRTDDEDRERDKYRRFQVKNDLFSGRPANTITESWEPWERSNRYWKGLVKDGGRIVPHQLSLW